MNHKRIETYFISRKYKLLKDFDNLMKKVGTVLISQYGKEFAETVVSETRQEYSKLIPEIPYVGQNRILVQFITGRLSHWQYIEYLAIMAKQWKRQASCITLYAKLYSIRIQGLYSGLSEKRVSQSSFFER